LPVSEFLEHAAAGQRFAESFEDVVCEPRQSMLLRSRGAPHLEPRPGFGDSGYRETMELHDEAIVLRPWQDDDAPLVAQRARTESFSAGSRTSRGPIPMMTPVHS